MTTGVDFAVLKILVIDDQEFVRTIVKKMLGQLGVGTVLDSADAHAGLETAQTSHPDLIICDIQMRPLDGFGFVRKLREQPATAAIPVVMLTAHTDAAALDAAQGLDIAAFLAKPVLPAALKDKIVTVLGRG